MAKTKQKGSGCFRSLQRGKFFAQIRSYTSTLHKQNRSVLDGIKQVFLQNPDFNWVAE